MNGYGLLAVYKSDWIRFGGKFKVNLTAEESNVPFNFFFWGGWGGDSKNRIADFELPDEFLSKELLAKNLSVGI